METTEIQERNKQIALMLGWYHEDYIWKMLKPFRDGFISETKDVELQFHTDWNWLMEAVEFVESRGYEIDIFANCVEICTTPDEDYVSEAVGKTKKEAVFLIVSDFAKLYNENKL